MTLQRRPEEVTVDDRTVRFYDFHLVVHDDGNRWDQLDVSLTCLCGWSITQFDTPDLVEAARLHAREHRDGDAG